MAKMRHFTTRLPDETAQPLLEEGRATNRSMAEMLRHLANRYVARETETPALTEKVNQLHSTVRELGRDLETVTRLLLVAAKIVNEEDAKEWCRKNLRVGR